MDLTDEQWAVLEPLLPEEERVPARKPGRPWKDPRAVLNGVLWILRTGAPWQDLPKRYPPYQTCHRRFQRWVRQGVMDTILQVLARDLKERGGLDVKECFIDGTFVAAKKGAMAWERPSGAKVRNSWQWQTALVFQSPYASQVLARMK
jgi:transposase